MVPNKRQNFHNRELMESIRRRTIWIHRIKQQRDINNAILSDASKCMSEAELEARFSYKTADSAAYFKPASYKGANSCPNFWQHSTERHVIPAARWRRVPELGGITRVEGALAEQASGY
ncbi:hypothetical protein STCU_03520 [Strigomonas culicis]|nr:hypothetical protein STCU_07679 [Strigomonas culicis]EPY31310.1 hypothetical protein STCU_03520 [Strigomonas culicis]|eukprot:EPY23523.1 hypothetical protein STCU_07679 [Strigomonas culicis]